MQEMNMGTSNSIQSAAEELAEEKPNPQTSSNPFLERLKVGIDCNLNLPGDLKLILDKF